MKKQVLKSSVFAGILSLFLLFPGWKQQTLKEITKPYLGEYECKQATFDGEDYLKDFSYIRLELKAENMFELSYADKENHKGKTTGKYVYDPQRKVLTLESEKGGIKKSFPLKDGEICITIFFGDKTLAMKFEQK